MENDIFIIFSLFIIYSHIGWLIEVICKLIEKHRFINRGFLIGPICPIYGTGSVIITLLLTRYKSNIITLFFMAILVCSILEYTTSYIMEKIFKTRWWDYSTKKYNINGRICLETMIPFGLLGCFIIYVLNPVILKMLSHIDYEILIGICFMILFIYIIDSIISFMIIFNFKETITNIEKDATEEITKKVKNIFLEKGFLYRRLINAFPNMKNPREYLLDLKEKIDTQIEIIDKKIKK